MPSPLNITGDAELKCLLRRLVDDIIEAGAYVRLHKHFDIAFKEYETEVNQTAAFWVFTEKAIREASLLRLARIFDQDHRAVSLLSVLQTIGHHTEFFDDASVLKRVSDSYREVFQSGSHRIDEHQLDEDLKLVSADDALVKKLIRWRSNLGAHIAVKPVLRPSARSKDPLTRDDVFALVDRALAIFNRYLSAFEGSTYSSKVIGEESHEFLFKMLRLGLQKYEEDIEREFSRYEKSERDGPANRAARGG